MLNIKQKKYRVMKPHNKEWQNEREREILHLIDVFKVY